MPFKTKKHRVVLVLCAMLLAGCSGMGSAGKTDAPENPNIAPANYRTEILNQLQITLDDPTGIRDAFIAEPAMKQSGAETRYIGCVRYNAKNSEGKYAGVKEKAVFFYAGRMTSMLDATREQCGSAAYQPFPELEKLCRISGCAPVRQ